MKNKKILILCLALVIVIALLFPLKKLYNQSKNQDKPAESSKELTTVKPYKHPELKESYDVVVVGGEPEGVAAAVAAARSGSKTLLIEHRDGLGGLFTYGMLNFLDLSQDKKGAPANTGIFSEWHKLVGNQTGFDIKEGKLAFLKLVQDEPNLTLSLKTQLVDVVKEQNQLTGIKIKDAQGQEKTIEAKAFIDSTQDADLAVKAGAPYFEGGEDIGLKDRKMAVTLMIHLKGVDWEEMRKAAAKGLFGGGNVRATVGWGFTGLHTAYKPTLENTRLRGLNIVKQKDGTVFINALQIFGIDGLDPESKQKAIEIGKQETKGVVEFLQKNFPGFEKAEIVDYPNELYVRETRHIKAEYAVKMSDVWENRDQWDSIGFGAYPSDVQATSPQDYGYVMAAPVQYAIPFRSLVPQEIDGLLVASKASGYSSLAAGSARVVPTGMSAGQAAGVAASLAIKNDISFRDMSKDKKLIETLRDQLEDQGAKLYHFDIKYNYQGEWYYPAVQKLLNYGAVVGGYENKLPVDKPFSEKFFFYFLANTKRISPVVEQKYNNGIMAVKDLAAEDDTPVTRNKAAQMIMTYFGEPATGNQAWKALVQKGIVNDTFTDHVKEDRELKGKEAYYLAYLMYQYIEKETK